MTTQSEKRKLYRTMTAVQIIEDMGQKELEMNARRGGVMAIEELTRRGIE